MARQGEELHVETDAARGGSTPHIARWVLGISLVAAIVLLSAIWIFGAATQGEAEEEASVSNEILENREAADTDGIVSENVDGLDAPDTGDVEDPALPIIEN